MPRARSFGPNLAGYAAALADLARMGSLEAREIAAALAGIGCDLAALRSAGVDRQDLDELAAKLQGQP